MKLRSQAKLVAEELARRVAIARADFRAGLVGLEQAAETFASNTRNMYMVLVFVLVTNAYTNISIHIGLLSA